MKPITWHNEKRKISEINPAEYNPRRLTDKQKADLKDSLDTFSLADPLVINKNNVLVGGHQRLLILKEQGVTEVDVRVPDRLLLEEEEKELNIRLNKNLGEFDFDALSQFDESLLQDIGFDAEEMNKIFQLDMGEPYQPELDENIETKNKCPKCGYEW